MVAAVAPDNRAVRLPRRGNTKVNAALGQLFALEAVVHERSRRVRATLSL